MNKEAFVAIVGEPNVGKSTLLNKIVAERIALTSGVAGTTRDRFYAPTSWNGVDFTLIDTAGIILEQKNELEKNVQKQVQVALEQCDLILYLLDGKRNPESVNREVLKRLRKGGKPIILAINKIDSPKKLEQAEIDYQFTGIKNIHAVSAVSGVGLGDLLDAISAELKKKDFGKNEKDPSEISISIIGKPNVGKSSLFNQILGEERVVVSNVPGTTRNVIDTQIEYAGKKLRILDTAGLKRKEKRAPLPDIYAAFQTMRTIYKSDVCILMIDASEGISQQDQKVAGMIVESSRGMIVAVNKIDLLTPKEREKLEKNLPDFFPFLWWAPIVPISAKSGEGVDDVLKYILKIEENRKKIIPAQELTEFFFAKLKQRQPQRTRDEKVPKVYSLAQVASDPPVFVMKVNKPSAIQTHFKKFIQNAIIKELGFWGTPIVLRTETKKGGPKDKPANVLE